MTKEVLISVSGLQFAMNSNETIEVITSGEYYSRGGKQYLLYDEVMEEYEGVSKNTIKFTDGIVDITKKGSTNVHMVFEEKKKNMTYYNTPFGNLMIGLYTNKIQIEEKEEDIRIVVDYALDINYEFISDCVITIVVRAKQNAGFALAENANCC